MKREEYIYRDCKLRMSTKAMSSLVYAALMTKAGLPTFFAIGVKAYTRTQNSHMFMWAKVHIHPSQIPAFEKEANVKLEEPIRITIS